MQGSAEGREDLLRCGEILLTQKGILNFYTSSQFVRSTYFSTALFLQNLEYELKLYELYETTVFLCHRKKMKMSSLDTG